MHRSLARSQLMSGINAGRQRLAQQFGTMEGWQAAQNTRFDDYVKEKRQKQFYEAFDQRVERAFSAAAKAHKIEILNAFKRKLKTTDAKFTASTTLEMRKAVEDRLHWLREVWSQIDADYRSDDAERQGRAAEEITAALRGEPGAYMTWVYELKREQRFMGDKQKAALNSELDSAELPEVSEEEATRYNELRLNMSEVERQVKTKYGLAGFQHWSELQAAKDAEYEEKLDTAAKVYHELLSQNDRYEESRRTALLRSNVARVHQAQVRFKAAMQLEEEREKMMEAHQSMSEARQKEAKEERVQRLREAAELKAQGATSEEVQLMMRQRQMDEHARRQAEYQLRERQSVQSKQAHYLDALERFKLAVETREGREMIMEASGSHGEDDWTLARSSDGAPTPQRQFAAPRSRAVNAFGFDEADALPSDDPDGMAAAGRPNLAHHEASQDALGAHGEPRADLSHPHSATDLALKAELWSAISADTYEDPSRAIHQARLDADKAYDPLYANFFVPGLVQGKKYQRQNLGEYAAGNAMDGQVLQGANRISGSYQWGLAHTVVHDIDADGDTDYFYNGQWHVKDKETGDVDWRYEKKRGGPVFRGPRFYRMGAEREAKDTGSQSADPHPPTHDQRRRVRGASASPKKTLSQGYSGHREATSRSDGSRTSTSKAKRPLLNYTPLESAAVPTPSGSWRSS